MGRSDKGQWSRCKTNVTTRFEPKAFEMAVKDSRSQSIWAQSVLTSKVTLYLWIGLDVHPIYWSDALAVDGMAGGAAQLVAPQHMQADVVARRNLGGSVAKPLGRCVDKRSHVRVDGSAEALCDVVTGSLKFPDLSQIRRQQGKNRLRKWDVS